MGPCRCGRTESEPDVGESLKTACKTNSLFRVPAAQRVPAIRLVTHMERHKSMEFLLASPNVYFYLAM